MVFLGTPFRRRILVFLAFLLAAPCFCVVISAAPLQLYVSPDGSDEGPGVGWSPKRPYRTLPRAALAVQRLVGDGRGKVGIVVELLPGTYRLTSPLVLDPTHSGCPDGRVVFRAREKGSVVVTGGVPVDGWQRLRDGILVADWPAEVAVVRQLYSDGEQLPLARFPNVDPVHPRSGGMLYALGKVADAPQTALIYDRAKLDAARWRNPGEGRIVIWPGANWNCDRLPLAGVDADEGILRFRKARYEIRRGNRFYVEGLVEELDAPGEWVVRTADRELLLKPTVADPDGARVTVPVSVGLVVLRGGKGKGLSHTTFEGIRFMECRGAAVLLDHAHDCEFVACEVSRTEDAGIVLRNLSSRNRIEGCDIAWTGTEGIRLEGIRDTARKRTAALSDNVIENCHVHHVGTSRNAGGAIDVRPYCGGNITHDNVFRRNLIHDTPRKGIMMGGVRNIAERNHILHVNLEQSDTGAIGLCTRDVRERGCIIRHNLIHDVGGYNMLKPGEWAFPSYCWAVYLDDWTSGTEVVGNILLDAPYGGVHVHSGLDNVIEHNIIRGSGKTLIQFTPITPKEQDGKTFRMSGNRVRRNVGVGAPGTPWLRGSGDLPSGLAECDRNWLWFDGTAPFCTVSRTSRPGWREWQALGFDRNSRLSRPTFVAGAEWQVRPDGIAAALGIRPIPVREIGLYQSASRFTWPVRTDWEREDPILSCKLPLPPSARKRAEIPALSGVISIDGRLSDAEWQAAAALILERNHRDEPAQPRSLAYVGFTRDALYIAMDNVVNPGKALATGSAWGKNDAIEVALRTRTSDTDAPIVVLRGSTDGSLSGSSDGGMQASAASAAADACSYAAAIVSPLHWTTEVRIPWGVIPGSAGKPCELQFNLTCRKTADNLFLCWKPTGRHSYGVGEEGVLSPVVR